MKEILSNKYLQILLRLIIGGIYVYVAWNKLVNPEEFAKAIKNYDMLPLQVINIIAITLPYIELFAGLFLIFGFYKKGSSVILGLTLVVFIIALTSAYARGLNIDCGCGFTSTTQEASSKTDLLVRIFQDILMLLGVVIIYLFGDKKKDAEPVPQIENQTT
ncbi:MAG: DoxX family membrane protein [Ignavibacteriae bacterium]|nr:DoxX family membrane protein [Ignavibacteriota bacterium]